MQPARQEIDVLARDEVAQRQGGKASLRLGVSGMLQLRCQRCLEAMPFELRAEDLLVLAATQAEIDAEPINAEAPDRVLAGERAAARWLARRPGLPR